MSGIRLRNSTREEPLSAFKLPPGSCDCHCHVFGPAARFPYSADRRYTPADSPKETLAALHRRLGFERAVIVQASAHGTDNRAMLDALASDPRRYRGVALIDDSFSDRDLERMHEAGVRGARFNFVRSLGGHPDMAVFHRTVERIKALGWHVVLHFSGPDIPELSPIIRALPVPFVIDHMGRVDAALGTGHEHFQELLRLVMLDGAWVKLSGAERMTKRPYDVAMPFARALFAARPDRVLWGTDFPHPNLKDSVDETETVALIPQFAPTLAQQQALLVDNPTRLYGFT